MLGKRVNGQNDVLLFRNKVGTLDRFLFDERVRRRDTTQPGTTCADERERRIVRGVVARDPVTAGR